MPTHDKDKIIAAAKEVGITHNTWDNQDECAVINFYAIAFAAGAASRDTEIAELVAFLTRYRNETPVGHQPHMIAHLVDEALAKVRKP